MTKWTADLTWKKFGTTSFVPSSGLGLSGEIGWHTHGSADNIDVDIDLAIVIGSDEAINASYTTMAFWGLPIGDDFTLSEEPTWEVGALEYKRGYLSQVETWNLT